MSSLLKAMVIRVLVVVGVSIAGFAIISKFASNGLYVSSIDCEGPSITEVGICRRDGSCTVKADDGKNYRVISPVKDTNICFHKKIEVRY